jgi:hypothetical protein
MHRATQISVVLAVGTLAVLLMTQDGAGPARADGGHWIFDPESRGILQGRVQLDEDIPPGHVRVGLWFEGLEGGQRFADALDERGAFLFDPVPTGFGRLTLWVEDDAHPLLEVPDVRVGEGAVDPRLFELDLRGRLSRFEVEILDPLGEPVGRALVGWRPFGPGAYEQSVEVRDGRATLVSSQPLVDLLVQAPGLRTEEVLGVDVGTCVALREGVMVAIEPPPAAFDGVGDPALELRLVREDLDPRFGRRTSRVAEFLQVSRTAAVRDGAARLALPAPGIWRLEWRAVLTDDRWVALGDERSAARIEVAAAYHEQRFQPAFPLSDLRAVRAR